MAWFLLAAREVFLLDDGFAEEHLGYVAELAGLLEMTRARVRAGCKEDLLQLVQVRNVGRNRARTLSKMGIRTPADLLSMDNKALDELKSKRGWGPVLVDRILESVRKLSKNEDIKKPRSDDEPLPGERQY